MNQLSNLWIYAEKPHVDWRRDNMITCVFCEKMHVNWGKGRICPRCWADILRAERKERRKNAYERYKQSICTM